MLCQRKSEDDGKLQGNGVVNDWFYRMVRIAKIVITFRK